MNDSALQDAVIKWVATTSRCQTIVEYQSGKTPSLPYVAVNYIQSREIRERESRFMYEEDDEASPPRVWSAPVIEVEYMFSLKSFSTLSPTDILRQVRSASKVNQACEPLMPMFQVHSVSEIKNLHEWDNEAWKHQAQMDLFIRGLEVDGHLIDTIEEFNFLFERTHGV